jgi:hypothetical protein
MIRTLPKRIDNRTLARTTSFEPPIRPMKIPAPNGDFFRAHFHPETARRHRRAEPR